MTGIFPTPSIQDVLGLESDFLDVITGLVQIVYDLIQQGAEKVVDLVLSFPFDDDFDAVVRSQFAGCCITLFFMVSAK